MLIHYHIFIKCTQTVLLPLAIMGKILTNWNSTPHTSLLPHTCQRFRQRGQFYGVKEERTVDANNWHISLAWRRHLPLKHLSDMNSNHPFFSSPPPGKHTLLYSMDFNFQKSSFFPFLHLEPLDLLYWMCSPATWQRNRERNKPWESCLPGRPFSDLGPQTRPLTETIIGIHLIPP